MSPSYIDFQNKLVFQHPLFYQFPHLSSFLSIDSKWDWKCFLYVRKDRSEEEKGREKEKKRVHLPRHSVTLHHPSQYIVLHILFCSVKNQERKPELTHLTHSIRNYSFYRALVAVKLLTKSLNPVFAPGLLVVLRIKIILVFTLQCTRELLHLFIYALTSLYHSVR